jgi:hypothetical protein
VQQLYVENFRCNSYPLKILDVKFFVANFDMKLLIHRYITNKMHFLDFNTESHLKLLGVLYFIPVILATKLHRSETVKILLPKQKSRKFIAEIRINQKFIVEISKKSKIIKIYSNLPNGKNNP